MITLSRGEKVYAVWCLAALAIGAAVWVWALNPPAPHWEPKPAETNWTQATRTYLTTQAGDAFLTTAVVHPEDLDR